SGQGKQRCDPKGVGGGVAATEEHWAVEAQFFVQWQLWHQAVPRPDGSAADRRSSRDAGIVLHLCTSTLGSRPVRVPASTFSTEVPPATFGINFKGLWPYPSHVCCSPTPRSPFVRAVG